MPAAAGERDGLRLDPRPPTKDNAGALLVQLPPLLAPVYIETDLGWGQTDAQGRAADLYAPKKPLQARTHRWSMKRGYISMAREPRRSSRAGIRLRDRENGRTLPCALVVKPIWVFHFSWELRSCTPKDRFNLSGSKPICYSRRDLTAKLDYCSCYPTCVRRSHRRHIDRGDRRLNTREKNGVRLGELVQTLCRAGARARRAAQYTTDRGEGIQTLRPPKGGPMASNAEIEMLRVK